MPAPRTIRPIAARREFQLPNGKPVVLTIGVPQPVPKSDWGCAVQITGIRTALNRPRYVFGIDGLQALHLAIKCAATALESANVELAWLGETGNLGMPKFLPDLPEPHRQRFEAMVEREAATFWRRAERVYKAHQLKNRNRSKAGDGT